MLQRQLSAGTGTAADASVHSAEQWLQVAGLVARMLLVPAAACVDSIAPVNSSDSSVETSQTYVSLLFSTLAKPASQSDS
jgi:hypothetical protein